MPGAREDRHRFELDGGTVALDFVNTVSGMRGGADEHDRLAGYPDVVYWAEQVGLIDSRRAAELYALAEAEPERAAAALEEAIRRREALHDVVLSAIEGRAAPDAGLEIVNAWIADALAHRRFRAAASSWRWKRTATGSRSCGPWRSTPRSCSRTRSRATWSASAKSGRSGAVPGSSSTPRAITAVASATCGSAATGPSSAGTTSARRFRGASTSAATRHSRSNRRRHVIAARAPVRYDAARLRRRRGMPERYIVVGGGLAGLMTVIKLAEAGKHVDVFSIVPVKRSHSVCA